MQYQSEIATISRVAPPTYAEAMAQAASLKAPTPNAPTTVDGLYDQTSSVPPYVPETSASQTQSSSYSRVGSPPVNTSYIGSTPIQQNTTPPCVVRVDRVVYKTRWKDRCCSPKVTAGLFTFFILIVMVKLIVSHSAS